MQEQSDLRGHHLTHAGNFTHLQRANRWGGIEILFIFWGVLGPWIRTYRAYLASLHVLSHANKDAP